MRKRRGEERRYSFSLMYVITKQSIMQKEGTSLVVIPCWWNSSLQRYLALLSPIFLNIYLFLASQFPFPFIYFNFVSSLAATIYFYRPDLCSQWISATPICLTPPKGFFHGIILFHPPFHLILVTINPFSHHHFLMSLSISS